ncbi:MAG: phosphate acetyltransferase [Ignavibacterium sp.]|jgi:phosphate acetyltransferase|nr:MAG: phosphate acetyltransferase [Ignavibacterium sp.]MDD5607443.1 phosphate acetyltransferase [Ignavibacterium sp.]MDX9712464.1 phosphate acetyltransferase [Ignavibacteriaceae bacterium]GIK21836.1 MAG: phosphate acetyltransferase [Ignavibacteriota bacterium]
MGYELLDKIKANAKLKSKTVILPESHDERVLKASEILTKEKICKVITLGNPSKINEDAKRIGVDLSGVEVIDHLTHSKFAEFANIYYELRKKKGMTAEQAVEVMKRDIFFAAMMLREGLVDGSVAGSFASTADVMKAGIQIVGMPQGISIVSSFFLMLFKDKAFSFADCAVVPNPDAQQLADIAISTADNHKKLTGEEPLVAMLSFSTKGSAKHELADKVIQATEMVRTKRADLNVDGELQFDTAIVASIGKKKAPESKVAGLANVLVFPDLNAGNIGYKIAQRWGGAEAVGPMVQGLQKPFFDLSRGCSVDDIVNTASINVLMG